MSGYITYHRPDGVIGVGFQIDFAGRRQHSVAWPDRKAERFMDDELQRLRIQPVPAVRVAATYQGVKADLVMNERDKIAPESPPSTAVPEPADQPTADVGTTVEPAAEDAADADAVSGPDDATSSAVDAEEIARNADDAAADCDTSSADDATASAEQQPLSEAEAIRQFLTDNSAASNAEVIEALAASGYQVNSSQVSRQRKRRAGA